VLVRVPVPSNPQWWGDGFIHKEYLAVSLLLLETIKGLHATTGPIGNIKVIMLPVPSTEQHLYVVARRWPDTIGDLQIAFPELLMPVGRL